MPRVVDRDKLLSSTGTESGPTAWLTIEQDRIDRFADATDDHQFIHVDPDRAAGTPFGSTIAHGFLSLSLVPALLHESTEVPEGMLMGINYGLNKVRFVEPVPVGSQIRARSKVLDVTEKEGGRILVTREVSVEIRGVEKPALVAETLTLFMVGPQPEEA